MKRIAITISREYGSGGRLIARRVADELGITFYDKQLISDVAKHTGFSEDFIQGAEHKRPTNSLLYDLYCAVQTPSVSEQIFTAQAKVIRDIAARESCVIVGRCADYLLKEEPGLCLRVFVFAPLEERVRRAREEYGVEGTPGSVESYVVRQDKARASYHNYFAMEKWGDSRSYDLCINSALGVERAADAIAALARSMARD